MITVTKARGMSDQDIALGEKAQAAIAIPTATAETIWPISAGIQVSAFFLCFSFSW